MILLGGRTAVTLILLGKETDINLPVTRKCWKHACFVSFLAMLYAPTSCWDELKKARKETRRGRGNNMSVSESNNWSSAETGKLFLISHHYFFFQFQWCCQLALISKYYKQTALWILGQKIVYLILALRCANLLLTTMKFFICLGRAITRANYIWCFLAAIPSSHCTKIYPVAFICSPPLSDEGWLKASFPDVLESCCWFPYHPPISSPVL